MPKPPNIITVGLQRHNLRYWYDGYWHREDGPAKEWTTNGAKEYFVKGKFLGKLNDQKTN